jgi:hypothetical protein
VKDFDVERKTREEEGRDARTFRLGGETFVVKAAIRPEALTEYENLTGDASASDTLGIIDRLILAFIEPGDLVDDPHIGEQTPDDDGTPAMIGERHLAYRQVRERDADPLGLPDLESLVEWLIETQTERPTGPPSSSGASRRATGNGSTDASSSRGSRAATKR